MKHKRRKYAVVVIVLLMFSVIVASVPIVNAGGTITLSTMSAAPGASVSVSGRGFGAAKAVAIGFGAEVNMINDIMPVTGPFDVGTGPYIGYLSHPPIKPGTYTMSESFSSPYVAFTKMFDDAGNGTLIKASAVSNASIVNATMNYVTSQFTVFTNGIMPNSTREGYRRIVNYTYYQYNLTPAAGVTTDSSGSFTANFTVPNVSNGNYTVTTIDTSGNIATSSLSVSWASTLQDWNMTVDGRSLKAYPDLKETVWVKNATMPPNGQYDKIGLHRLVKTGSTSKGVIFVCPRIAWSGEAWISNPLTDNFTKTENNSQPIYWANRGFDVYAVDYRTHFVPSTLNTSQLAFMLNWTYGLWVNDIKEAVEKAKAVSGASKVFMVGPSNGGGATMMYATKYWKEDLKGIILPDALIYNGRAAIVAKNTTGTNTYNLTNAVNNMISTATWGTPSFTVQQINRAKYALANPGAPAEDPPGTPLTPTINPLTNRTWANITEWFAYTLQTSGAANVYDGYGSVTEYLIHTLAAEPFTSGMMSLESQAMADWTDCPYVPYDFDDHFNEINVPLLAFASGPLYSNKTGTFRFINGINNTDFTGVMLPKYGHTDVYMGTYSARDVSEPVYQWMLGHLTSLDVSAFQSVTVMPGWTWWFFAQNLGGNAPYTYQWYEGLNPIQGQTSMVLPITKTAPGVYSFYCRVTDKDGTTTTSNAVTLTVIS